MSNVSACALYSVKGISDEGTFQCRCLADDAAPVWSMHVEVEAADVGEVVVVLAEAITSMFSEVAVREIVSRSYMMSRLVKELQLRSAHWQDRPEAPSGR